jgi:NLR family CARD domain-containing protein 3
LQLDLSGNELCGLDNDGDETYNAEGITAIADALRVNGGLSQNQLCGLNWEGKGIYSAEGVAAIADALRVNGALTKINVSWNIFGPGGAKVFADALRVNGGLTELSIYGNHVRDEGVRAICEAIQSNKETKLTSLNFGGNSIGPFGANAVAALVVATGGLTELNIANNSIKDEGITAICYAVQGNKESKLAKLNVAGNNISPVGATAVAAMVAVTGGLTSIDVSQNKIAGDGAVQLAAAVLGNLKIEIFNGIPIKEMRANSLTELDLNWKYFGVEGGMVVAGLIPVMGGLTRINFSGNNLPGSGRDMTGIKELAAALGVNGVLRLDLSCFSEEQLCAWTMTI